MPGEFHQPTKKELQTKYGIANDDFEVLTSAEEPIGEMIEKVADWVDVPTYLRRHRNLTVVAVIFFLPVAVHHFREAFATDVSAVKADIDWYKHLPQPANVRPYFTHYGTTSNSVVSVVTHIPLGPAAPPPPGPPPVDDLG